MYVCVRVSKHYQYAVDRVYQRTAWLCDISIEHEKGGTPPSPARAKKAAHLCPRECEASPKGTMGALGGVGKA